MARRDSLLPITAASSSCKSARSRGVPRCWRRMSHLQRSAVCVLAVTVAGCVLLLQAMEWPQSGAPLSIIDAGWAPHASAAGDQSAARLQAVTASSPELSINSTLSRRTEQEPMRFPGATNQRQRAVVEAFRHAWSAYRRDAWGYDQLKPLTHRGHTWFGLGLTLVDSLDTMYIMGLHSEFAEARAWVAEKLTFDVNTYVNVFETTIRVLGGLLSAHHLSRDAMFADKALQLGRRLLVAFDSPSGVPYSDVNLRTLKARGPPWNPDSSTAEVATLQLEFNQLSAVSGDAVFSQRAMRASRRISEQSKPDGLVGVFINPADGRLRRGSVVTLGARGDSYYEYLLKVYQQLGEPARFMRDDFVEAMRGVQRRLVARSVPSGLTFIGELGSGRASAQLRPKMDHLVCFLPSMLALAVHRFDMDASLMTLAEQLMATCYQMYVQQPTGLAPEIVYFSTSDDTGGRGAARDMYVKPADAHTLLRPETVESLWYLYHLTGNRTYQHWGWRIFGALERHARVASGGYSSLSNVLSVSRAAPRDSMESFFLAETLKYLYLLFADDQSTLNLRDFVFNSEAHPLPVLQPAAGIRQVDVRQVDARPTAGESAAGVVNSDAT